MPGLYGIINLDEEKPDIALFDKFDTVISPKEGKSYSWSSDNISLGFKSLGILDFEDQPFVDHNIILFFWGEVFSPPPGKIPILKHVISLYREDKLDKLAEIKGFFSFALWDEKNQTLVLACDIYGTRPLYYSQQANGIVFGPNPFAVAKVIEETEIDVTTLHQFLVFSTIFEDHTWVNNVKKLRYGQYLKFDHSGKKIEQYFKPALNSIKMTLEEAAENTLRLLSQSVNHMIKGKAAISLSGGGDSRLIAAICKSNEIPIQTFTYGSENSEDVRIAEKVTKALDSNHHSLHIANNFLKLYLRRAVYNTGGYASAVNFHGISTRAEVKKFCDTCITGLYGNNILGYLSVNLLKFMAHKSDRGFNHTLTTWLAPTGYSPFNPASYTDEVMHETIANLSKIYRQKSSYGTMEMIDHFEINSQRSMAGAWLENDTLEFRNPYCDHELLKFNLTIPAKHLRLMGLGKDIWQKHFPELGSIEYQRTGLPMTAPIMQVIISKIKAKKRPPGIMDYEYIFRQEINEWLMDLLTSKDSLIQNYIQPKFLEKMIADYQISRIAALVVIEQVLRILNEKS